MILGAHLADQPAARLCLKHVCLHALHTCDREVVLRIRKEHRWRGVSPATRALAYQQDALWFEIEAVRSGANGLFDSKGSRPPFAGFRLKVQVSLHAPRAIVRATALCTWTALSALSTLKTPCSSVRVSIYLSVCLSIYLSVKYTCCYIYYIIYIYIFSRF